MQHVELQLGDLSPHGVDAAAWLDEPIGVATKLGGHRVVAMRRRNDRDLEPLPIEVATRPKLSRPIVWSRKWDERNPTRIRPLPAVAFPGNTNCGAR